MAIRLDESDLSLVREQLLGDAGDQFVEYMYRTKLGLECKDTSDDVRMTARALEWDPDSNLGYSLVGESIADSCREYRFWTDRNRRLPFERYIAHLDQNFFTDKTVVEIGCGMGANLMSLQGVAKVLIGIEPIEIYVQMGEIFCERELLPQPDILSGTAENLPLEDSTCDVVLCIAAHQYFDIAPAFREISRVLRPGGDVIIIGSTLNLALSLLDVLKSPLTSKPKILTVLNTLSYMALEKRILPSRSEASTTRPIYPTQKAMCKWLSNAGLSIAPSCPRLGKEIVFHAQKLYAS